MDVQATVPIPQSTFAVFLAAMESATINAKVPEPSQGEEADTTHVVDDAGGKGAISTEAAVDRENLKQNDGQSEKQLPSAPVSTTLIAVTNDDGTVRIIRRKRRGARQQDSTTPVDEQTPAYDADAEFIEVPCIKYTHVPAACVGTLLGKGANRLLKLESVTGCIIDMPSTRIPGSMNPLELRITAANAAQLDGALQLLTASVSEKLGVSDEPSSESWDAKEAFERVELLPEGVPFVRAVEDYLVHPGREASQFQPHQQQGHKQHKGLANHHNQSRQHRNALREHQRPYFPNQQQQQPQQIRHMQQQHMYQQQQLYTMDGMTYIAVPQLGGGGGGRGMPQTFLAPQQMHFPAPLQHLPPPLPHDAQFPQSHPVPPAYTDNNTAPMPSTVEKEGRWPGDQAPNMAAELNRWSAADVAFAPVDGEGGTWMVSAPAYPNYPPPPIMDGQMAQPHQHLAAPLWVSPGAHAQGYNPFNPQSVFMGGAKMVTQIPRMPVVDQGLQGNYNAW